MFVINYFLSDYCNVMFVTIKKCRKSIIKLYFTHKKMKLLTLSSKIGDYFHPNDQNISQN